MSIIAILFIGAFIGWLVAAVLEFDEGIFAHMLLGAMGAFLGSLVPQLTSDRAMLALTWGTIAWCVIGALFVTGIATAVTPTNKNSGV